MESTENLEKPAEGEAILEFTLPNGFGEDSGRVEELLLTLPDIFYRPNFSRFFLFFCLITIILLFGYKISRHNCKKT